MQWAVVRGLYRPLSPLVGICCQRTDDFTVDGRSKHTRALSHTCLIDVGGSESYKNDAGSNAKQNPELTEVFLKEVKDCVQKKMFYLGRKRK